MIKRLPAFPEKQPAKTIVALLALLGFGLVTGLYSRFSVGWSPTWLQTLDLATYVFFVSLLIVILPRTPWVRIPLAVVIGGYFIAMNVGFDFYVRFYQSWPTADVFFQWRDAGGLGTSFAHLVRAGDIFVGGLLAFGLLLLALRATRHLRRLPVGLALFALVLAGEIGFEVKANHPYVRAQNEPLMYVLRESVSSLVVDRFFPSDRVLRVDQRVDRYYPTDERVYRYQRADTARLGKTPRPDRPPREFKKMNVLIVLLESMRAYEMGVYGSAHSLTPNLDRLGKRALVFDPFYASTPQTQRAEAAIHCSLYERVQAGAIFTLYPKIHASCLPSVFGAQGYHTLLLKSYQGNYANSRTFFANHGMQELHDVADYAKISHQDIGWGPADEDHFRHSVDLLDRARKPFFAEIMSLSNHFPYTQSYPTDGSFPLQLPDGDYRNLARGLYYTDFAFGKLMDELEKRPWFKDTLLVVLGDHGIWRFPPDVQNDMTKKLEVYFRNALILYTPNGMVAPGVNHTLGSQIDIPPTILDILGLEVPNGFAGRSLLAPDGRPRYVLMVHDDQWNIRRGDDYCYDSTGQFVEVKFYGPKRPRNYRPGQMYCFRYHGDLLRDPVINLPKPDSTLRGLREFGLDLNAYNQYLLKNDVVYRRAR